MSEMYFEDHPTDPDKVIIRKPQRPQLDQGPDYERGFIDGMQYQMQSSVDKAVNKMAQAEQEPMCVKVSPLEFVEIVMEKEHLVGKPIIWAQWPNKEET